MRRRTGCCLSISSLASNINLLFVVFVVKYVNTHVYVFMWQRGTKWVVAALLPLFLRLRCWPYFRQAVIFLNSSHHCLITQQPFPHSSMANHCSIATCLLLLSCHYGLLIAGQSTKKICHEKAVAAALNGSATKMRKRKKKKFIIAICYMTTMILNAPPVHSSESILL